MSVQFLSSQAEEGFAKALAHLQEELKRLQIGRASSAFVENIQVEAYGSTQPVKALAGISIPDARTIQIQPWDSSVLAALEKAVRNSDLGLNPVNDGRLLRIVIPPMTEERRRDLTKLVGSISEDARIAVRNARHGAYAKLKDLQKSKEISEDELRHAEKKLQEKVDQVNKQIDEIAQKKEADIMSI